MGGGICCEQEDGRINVLWVTDGSSFTMCTV